MSRRIKLVLLCASMLVGAALFEVAFRAANLDFNLSPNWKYHPVLGWSQVPSATYDIVLEDRRVQVSFNSAGFRDIEHEEAKPPGVKRIVVIGDSFSEAVQVNLDETFHRRLEGLLNQEEPGRWEVINLGVGDFGTAQAVIALNEYGLAFDPDVVIHQIFPLNDICNNSLSLFALCRSDNDRYRPYFVEADGELRQTYQQPIRTVLRRHVVSYGVVERRFLTLTGHDALDRDDPARGIRLLRSGFRGLDPLLLTYVPAERQPEAVAQGWRITETLIERLVRVTRERGIAYLGMVVPFEMRLHPDWESFAQRQPPPGMDRKYPERRLSAHFDRLGVGSVMLMDDFQPYIEEVLPYLSGHLSVAGHRRAAEALHRELVESGIAAPKTELRDASTSHPPQAKSSKDEAATTSTASARAHPHRRPRSTGLISFYLLTALVSIAAMVAGEPLVRSLVPEVTFWRVSNIDRLVDDPECVGIAGVGLGARLDEL